jgi:hypothetical protein
MLAGRDAPGIGITTGGRAWCGSQPGVSPLARLPGIESSDRSGRRRQSSEPLAAEAVQAAAERMRLPLLQAASGFTEWLWEQDGFRVYVSRTFAKVFQMEKQARWWTWADGPAGERAARNFLAQAAEHPGPLATSL